MNITKFLDQSKLPPSCYENEMVPPLLTHNNHHFLGQFEDYKWSIETYWELKYIGNPTHMTTCGKRYQHSDTTPNAHHFFMLEHAELSRLSPARAFPFFVGHPPSSPPLALHSAFTDTDCQLSTSNSQLVGMFSTFFQYCFYMHVKE